MQYRRSRRAVASGVMPAARVVVATCLMLASCARAAADRPVVFAASSLNGVMQELAPRARISFGASNELALQIAEGAPADVFCSAEPGEIERLRAAGLAGRAVELARNRLAVLVAQGARAPATLAGLAAPGVRLVVAARGVPLGDYTRQALTALSLEGALRNVISEENDARAVVTKVLLGEADAGIVYASDARPGARLIDIPRRAQPDIVYVCASVAVPARRSVADRLLARLTSQRSKTILTQAGFSAP